MQVQSVLDEIPGFRNLSTITLRWVVSQYRDPGQAINSICAEIADPRRLVMAIERLAEVVKDQQELNELVKSIGSKNLRALSYLLRAELSVSHNRYRVLLKEFDEGLDQKIREALLEQKPNEVVQRVNEIVTWATEELKDQAQEICNLLGIQIDGLKGRLSARARRKMVDMLKSNQETT